MKNELKDILSRQNNTVEQDKLLQYVNRDLSDAEQHEVEKEVSDDDFMTDAIEGLQQLENKEAIPGYVQHINAGLKKHLDKKKQKRKKRALPPQFWTYLTVIILLILFVLAYLVLRKAGT